MPKSVGLSKGEKIAKIAKASFEDCIIDMVAKNPVERKKSSALTKLRSIAGVCTRDVNVTRMRKFAPRLGIKRYQNLAKLELFDIIIAKITELQQQVAEGKEITIDQGNVSRNVATMQSQQNLIFLPSIFTEKETGEG